MYKQSVMRYGFHESMRVISFSDCLPKINNNCQLFIKKYYIVVIEKLRICLCWGIAIAII